MTSRAGYEVDGLRIAKARQALGITQSELSSRAGVHRVTLTKIENGAAKVSLDLLERLSQILGVTREHVLGVPEHVDPIEAARSRIADAMSKVSDGFADLADLIETLNGRARDQASAKAAV